MVDKVNVAGEVFNIMTNRVLLDTVINGRRYMLSTDKYNYIWKEGSPELDDKISEI